MGPYTIGGKWLDDLNADLTGSDRSCAVLAGAILDDRLLRLLQAYLLPPAKSSEDRLFGRGRPLDTFAARIELARRLNLVEPFVAKALDYIRDIRNLAAHKPDFAFNQDEVASKVCNVIEKLRLRERASDMLRKPYTGTKGEFLVAVTLLVAHIEIETGETKLTEHKPTSALSRFHVCKRDA